MAKVEKTLAKNATEAKKKDKKKSKKVVKEPRKSKVKETVSELKKVSWPTFGQTMKQTGMVLSVVAVFMLVTLGIDSLLSWLLKLITNM